MDLFKALFFGEVKFQISKHILPLIRRFVGFLKKYFEYIKNLLEHVYTEK